MFQLPSLHRPRIPTVRGRIGLNFVKAPHIIAAVITAAEAFVLQLLLFLVSLSFPYVETAIDDFFVKYILPVMGAIFMMVRTSEGPLATCGIHICEPVKKILEGSSEDSLVFPCPNLPRQLKLWLQRQLRSTTGILWPAIINKEGTTTIRIVTQNANSEASSTGQ